MGEDMYPATWIEMAIRYATTTLTRKAARNPVKRKGIQPPASGVEQLEARTMLAAAIPAFAAQMTFSAGPAPSAVSVADLNRDGKTDLVVALDGSQQMLLYSGNG